MRGGPTLGIGGLILVVAVSYFTGQDPMALLQLLSGASEQVSSAPEPGSAPPPKDQLGVFAGTVLADTEETWKGIFASAGRTYEEPPLVLFTQAVRSGCGTASSGMGPFYCPADHKVYLDPAFFQELTKRFGAPGDFAQAYVIAHEVGHHVQNLTGVSDQVTAAQQRGGEAQANALSVRLELQADCFAGVWGHHANRDRKIIDPGDFEEGMRAAASIGDDSIQEMSGGSARPESWTHGSGEQRQFWLRRGLESGDWTRCDTFKEKRP
jgi:predicted metalloprotease